MSQRLRVWNLCTDSKPCRARQSAVPDLANAKYFFVALALNHFRCGKWGMLYLLDRSRRPRLLRPARFKKRGGRANRRRCARWRRFPSDCRIPIRSNTDNGRAVSKFLWARLSCLAGSSKSRLAKSAKEKCGTGKSSEGRPRAGGSLDGLNELAERLAFGRG